VSEIKSEIKAELLLEDFPSRISDTLRRRDTAGHGHVNNVVFPSYCDNGRANVIYDPEYVALTPGLVLFVARLAIDYRAELFWPGTVEIGTGIRSVGRTSVTFFQGLFQNGKCAATAETVLVQVEMETSAKVPFTAETRDWLLKRAV
jgi:acyl-CoA thioester hydrolase